MNSATADSTCPAEAGVFCARKHWSIYWLIIVIAISVLSGRVLTLRNPDTKGESPFFSANDRSRWCTVRSLVDFGTFEIDDVIREKSDIHWDTIDKVQHIGADGQLHFYSSKPPLLSVIVAGQYWAIKQVTGWRLDQQPVWIARVVLLLTNVLPFGLMLWFLASILERMLVADWTRYFVLCSAAFGTFLSTFAITLNNHLPAAVATMGVLYGLHRIMTLNQRERFSDFALVGFMSTFATACELPAAILMLMALILCVARSPRYSLLGWLPAASLVVATFAFTSYKAHGFLELAYAHRNDGAVAAVVHGDFSELLDRAELPTQIVESIDRSSLSDSYRAMKLPTVQQGAWMGQSSDVLGRWVIRDAAGPQQIAITQSSKDVFQIHQWNNWYDYPGSYWLKSNDRRSAVDQGQTSRTNYAFHVLFGHHGIFSLTPLWILSAAGLLALTLRRQYGLRWLGVMGIVASLVVVEFYLSREPHDRNYGGMTSGLRWAFWLIPIWLVALAPIVQLMAGSKRGRAFCLLLLFASIISAAYSANNPWVHPWLYEIWNLTGLPK